MRKNQKRMKEKVMLLKPWEGANAACFQLQKKSFRRMMVISPLLGNNFFETWILSFINLFIHSRNIYIVPSIILYNLCFVHDKLITK